MSTHLPGHFTALTRELAVRAARATLGNFGLTSHTLREHLRQRLERAAGESGGFLADPVFEAMFPWCPANTRMRDLAGGLLSPRLVEAMDAPPDELRDQRFGADWYPYAHQLEAWRTLQADPLRSAIVTSGTGSGKTECFLVPILDQLTRESEAHAGPLVGVRALFLYPLNALINSQRDRLRAWTGGLGGSVRFCLYNGETPDTVPASRERELPQEVLSRRRLRESPPPILVTNATMLEYMLVRDLDWLIRQASRGQLRWIVLDEAHTYVGSQSAELALLLRRVMHAFDVDAENVRFVATSATISSGDPDKVRRDLCGFLADVAGVSPDRVALVDGSRQVPNLSPELEQRNNSLPSASELGGLDSEALFARLASSLNIRGLRSRLASAPMTLERITEELFGSDQAADVQARNHALVLLDAATRAQGPDTALVPLRGHLFHRIQKGVWACINRGCSGRPETFDAPDADWPHGAVYLERREHCDHCGSIVAEVVVCNGCGSASLTCEERIGGSGRYLAARSVREDDFDEFEYEIDLLETDLESFDDPDRVIEPAGVQRLLIGHNLAGIPARVEPYTGELDPDGAAIDVSIVIPEPGARLRCPTCRTSATGNGDLFRPMRLGAPFYLSVGIPTLLEHTPAQGRDFPFGGRRLITFSDSRQGTARFAVKAQLDAERAHIRSLVYHQLASARAAPEGLDDEERAKKQAQLDEFERLDAERGLPGALADLRDRLQEEVSAASDDALSPGQVGWTELEYALNGARTLKRWMRDQWRELSYGDVDQENIARFCLYREFFRRPRRMNSLETLGLAALVYPAIERTSEQSVPAQWRHRGKSRRAWQDFLTIAVDYQVRANGGADVPEPYLRWLGIPAQSRHLLGPEDERPGAHQTRWPLIRGPYRRARLARLLAKYLGLDVADPDDAAEINELLRRAWDQIRPLLTEYPDGYKLSLRNVEVREVREAWLCPVTRRVLPVALDGITPYLPEDPTVQLSSAQRIQLPTLPTGFWRRSNGSVRPREEIGDWLESDERIAELRELGVWTEISDRIAGMASYFRTVEHSAQQPGARLQSYEARFKQFELNVLSCSTTMEMGVDIGGLAAVAMNNAPPSPANFLQRAGRAGRRGESVATSLTLCKGTPHGEAVFRRPMWPFETPMFVPRVALDSERVVQRHVNSLLLSEFLARHASAATALRLEVGAFMESPDDHHEAPVDRFAGWLTGEAASELDAPLRRLVRRTALEGIGSDRLVCECADQISSLHSEWLEEVASLETNLSEITGTQPATKTLSPAQAAIGRQLERMRGEYLLAELAAHGFLPGHGFPTDVVPFVPTTMADLKQRSSAKKSREDGFGVRRGYPSRELQTAVREYAPGADVVLDGRVYTSGGVTLNWHVPAGDTQVRETQAFRQFWRCRRCGATGTRASRLDACLACGHEAVLNWEYLRPAGFAVDIRHRPHNDINRPAYVPVRDPVVTAGAAPWISLPHPELGQYRYSANGHIFSSTSGSNQQGFAVCLHCGRADSEESLDGPLPRGLRDHSRLRGGRDPDGNSRCPGNESEWAIKRHLQLAAERITDVFELQLHDPATGRPVDNDTVGYSLAVGLRQALTESLGIDEREVGCATSRTAPDGGSAVTSVMLYDQAAGGAGYVANLVEELPRFMRAARSKLECPRACDAACHACLLSFDTEHHADQLHRHEALRFLDARFLDSLDVPEQVRVFGASTAVEQMSLPTALCRAVRKSGARLARLYLGGNVETWDLWDWPMRSELLRWLDAEIDVEIVTTREHLDGLDSTLLGHLAALADIGAVQVKLAGHGLPQRGEAWLVAELLVSDRELGWAVSSADSLAPRLGWANGAIGVTCVRGPIGDVEFRVTPTDLQAVPASALRPAESGNVTAIPVSDELTGPLSEFGRRFWALLANALGTNGPGPTDGARLTRLTYTDRYVCTPFGVRLLMDVVRYLLDTQGVASDFRGEIVTADYSEQQRRPRLISHTWAHALERDDVVRSLLDRLEHPVSLSTMRRPELPHARTLSAEWDDGSTMVLRLDQGFGYWRPNTDLPFKFDGSASDQAARIDRYGGDVRGDRYGLETVLYVSNGK